MNDNENSMYTYKVESQKKLEEGWKWENCFKLGYLGAVQTVIMEKNNLRISTKVRFLRAWILICY